jgi:hypothetical protein
MVLLRDHEHLGQQGDLVTVRAGYARHTLFPNGQADYAVPMVLRELQVCGALPARGCRHLIACRHSGGGSSVPSSTAALMALLLLLLVLLCRYACLQHASRRRAG